MFPKKASQFLRFKGIVEFAVHLNLWKHLANADLGDRCIKLLGVFNQFYPNQRFSNVFRGYRNGTLD